MEVEPPVASPTTGEVRPSEGWGVLHLFLRAEAGGDGGGLRRAIEAFAAQEPQQVIAASVLGGRADLALMALGPDLDALDRLSKAVLSGPVSPVYSFVSLTERSEYTSTDDDERGERERLRAEGVDDVEGRLAAARERAAAYLDARLHPRLPHRALIAFYPMSKSRRPGANWYDLPFAERKGLMRDHARVGRRYAGRVLQLITGATGLDDWEWGVTLLADDAATIKEIVYEMRFDPVSARYGEFGPFWLGLAMTPADALTRAGLALSQPKEIRCAD